MGRTTVEDVSISARDRSETSRDRGARRRPASHAPKSVAPWVGKQQPVRFVTLRNSPEELLGSPSPLERVLAGALPQRRWFRSKTRALSGVTLFDRVTLDADLWLCFVEAAFTRGDPEVYVLPVSRLQAAAAPATALLGIRHGATDADSWLVDASEDPRVACALLDIADGGTSAHGRHVRLTGIPTQSARTDAVESRQPVRALGVEQSNSTYVFGRTKLGKLVRKLEDGPSIEVALLEHLRRSSARANVPELLARIEVEFGRDRRTTLWTTQRYVVNQGSAWEVTLDSARRFIGSGPARTTVAQTSDPLSEYLPLAELLGRRTAELHVALADDLGDPQLSPQPFDTASQNAYHASLLDLGRRAFDELRRATLPERARTFAQQVLAREDSVRACLDRVLAGPLESATQRVHGDYHLGQVLYTGHDFVIIDFDGEPARSRAERLRRRSPLTDVAGMLRSFHYAAFAPLTDEPRDDPARSEDRAAAEPRAELFCESVSAAFLREYSRAVEPSGLAPAQEEFSLLLDVHLLEKALYEVCYELDNRPNWVELPLRGVLDVLARARG